MKKLDIKPYIQNPNSANCALNAMRAVCDYYYEVPPSRYELKKSLKTCHKSGTYFQDILDTFHNYDFKFTQKNALSWADIKRTIKSKNLIFISYQSGPKESHSSIISGYEESKGVKYVYLCDSWTGEIRMPFNVLRVLMNRDLGPTRALLLRE